MAGPKFNGGALRLVRSLDLVVDHGNRTLPVRVEFFQDPAHLTHFRYRVLAVESFGLQPSYHDELLTHRDFTALCPPNLEATDYFEAADLDAVEQKFYEDFGGEFIRSRKG